MYYIVKYVNSYVHDEGGCLCEHVVIKPVYPQPKVLILSVSIKPGIINKWYKHRSEEC